jgi:hypothetical protein
VQFRSSAEVAGSRSSLLFTPLMRNQTMVVFNGADLQVRRLLRADRGIAA